MSRPMGMGFTMGKIWRRQRGEADAGGSRWLENRELGRLGHKGETPLMFYDLFSFCLNWREKTKHGFHMAVLGKSKV